MHHLITMAVVAVGIPIMATAHSADTSLEQYRWKHRLLLLFSTEQRDHDYMAFVESLTAARAEVQGRDLIVFHLFDEGPSRVDTQPLSAEDVQRLKKRFRIDTGKFTVLLIGKDGGTKLVRRQKVDLQEIFDLIDSMPMRQQEMREKGRGSLR